MNDNASTDATSGDRDTAEHDLLTELADDFAARCRRGEHPSVEEYAQKHPELARQIRDILPALLAMEQSSLDPRRDMAPPAERIGAVIGRYKLLERIGEGGFGVVFMAEQQQPVRRKVALKVIKPGMDTKQVIARFEAERQALAMMDHPNIAKVLDAGATDSGRPYFVMELVPGIPITEYCDRERLAPRQRLELFVQVCQAVQHAHTKGIIHRDLKPTNVLVLLRDDKPVPKVIDFGVAKATGQQLTEMTLFTQFVQMVGTPLYMSPEQAQMGGLDVDTRSDIYSLGVLLYELLTGSTPFDSKRFGKAALDEVRRIIRLEEPPKPSTRLSTTDALPSIAACRGMEPKKLSGLMHGELDWIVMKALEKDRGRRYETANGFAMDVQRYLHDEAVQACPPTNGYRFRKFARRNKTTLLIASAALTALLVLVVGLAVSNRLIAAQRNEKAEALALATAESNRSKKNFLAASIAIREVITKGALGYDEWSQLTPALRRKLSDEALKFYSSLLQEESPDPSLRYETGVGYRSMALLHDHAGDRKSAEECYRKAITILEELSTAAPAEVQYRLQLAYTHYMLGGFLASGGRSGEAETSYRKSADLYVKLLADVPGSAEYRIGLATCLVAWQRVSDRVPYQQFLQGPERLPIQRIRAERLVSIGRVQEAEQLFSELGKEYEKLAAESPSVPEHRFVAANCESRAGQLLLQSGRAAEAEQMYVKSIPLLQRLADEFPKELKYQMELGRSHNWLGYVLKSVGKSNEAEQEHRRAIQLYTDPVKLADPVEGQWYRRELGWSRLNLGGLLNTMQRGPEAESEFRSAFALFEPLAAATPTDASYPQWMRDLCRKIGLLCKATNRREEAQKWFRRASELAAKDCAAHKELADLFFDEAMLPEAEAEAREAIRLQPDFVGAHSRLAQVLLREGNGADALAALREADRILKKPVTAESVTPAIGELLGHTLWQVGDAWQQLERLSEAEHDYLQALETFRQLEVKYPANAFYRQEQGFSHRNLANVTERAGRTQDAEHHLRDALSWYQKLVAEAPDSAFYRREEATVHRQLANLLQANGRSAEAEQALEAALSQHSAILAKRPEELDARRERGRYYLDRGDFNKALEDFSELIKIKPDVSWYWCDRGFAYLRLGEHEKSIADLSKAIGLADGVSERIMRGEAYRALGQRQKAETDFSRAIELRPDWDSWYRRGQLYAELGQWDKAISDLSTAARLNVSASSQIVEVLERTGRPEDAKTIARQSIPLLQQQVTAQPDVAENRLALARLYERLGQWDEAGAEFSKAIRLKPNNGEAWTGRAFAYFHRQQWEQAISDFNKAIELAPQVHTTRFHRGHAHLNLAHWDKAVMDFARVVEQWPKDPEGWYLRGVAYVQLNQPDNALADLGQAVAKGFKDAERMKTDGRLEPLRTNDDFKRLLADLERKRHPTSTTHQSGS